MRIKDIKKRVYLSELLYVLLILGVNPVVVENTDLLISSESIKVHPSEMSL